MFIILALMAGLLSPPELPTDVQRLGAHIMRVNPGHRAPFELADAIMTQSAIYGLDPAIMAALAWTESHYRPEVTGRSGEIGLWQLYPGPWLSTPWDEIRGYRPPWRDLSRRQRRAICRDLQTGAHFAAWLMSYHLQRCGDHRSRCYARYNSGNAKVRPYYVRHLRRRSRAIRRHLYAR